MGNEEIKKESLEELLSKLKLLLQENPQTVKYKIRVWIDHSQFSRDEAYMLKTKIKYCFKYTLFYIGYQLEFIENFKNSNRPEISIYVTSYPILTEITGTEYVNKSDDASGWGKTPEAEGKYPLWINSDKKNTVNGLDKLAFATMHEIGHRITVWGTRMFQYNHHLGNLDTHDGEVGLMASGYTMIPLLKGDVENYKENGYLLIGNTKRNEFVVKFLFQILSEKIKIDK